MVLTHTATHTYAHPFPTVTLAFFLRYSTPQLNPFAKHVLSTDTISSRIDPATGRLHTTRIHLKKSRLPSTVFKLLPVSLTGGGSGSSSSAAEKVSYILETSIVDMREGWMKTESRNLNFAGVLSVVETQRYAAPQPLTTNPHSATTNVETTVVFRSTLGDRIRSRLTPGTAAGKTSGVEADGASGNTSRAGWFARSWGALGSCGLQRTIESIASTKTQDQLGKSREGMRIILERLRQNGVRGVLELRRRTTRPSTSEIA